MHLCKFKRRRLYTLDVLSLLLKHESYTRVLFATLLKAWKASPVPWVEAFACIRASQVRNLESGG